MKIIREKEPKFEPIAIILESREEINIICDICNYANMAYLNDEPVLWYGEEYKIYEKENNLAIKISNKLDDFI